MVIVENDDVSSGLGTKMLKMKNEESALSAIHSPMVPRVIENSSSSQVMK
jgi:hypothetical protein